MSAEIVIIREWPKNTREHVRVALDEYQGTPLVDIRVCAEFGGPAGLYSPTKKGISMHVRHLPVLIEALTAAAERARGNGLLGAT